MKKIIATSLLALSLVCFFPFPSQVYNVEASVENIENTFTPYVEIKDWRYWYQDIPETRTKFLWRRIWNYSVMEWEGEAEIYAVLTY
jgi:hypothetical protein